MNATGAGTSFERKLQHCRESGFAESLALAAKAQFGEAESVPAGRATSATDERPPTYVRGRPADNGTPIEPKHSSYAGVVDGRLVRLPGGREVSREQHFLHVMVRAFVLHPNFPCLGAKAALHSDDYRLGAYGELGNSEVIVGLANDLYAFVDEQRRMQSGFSTFVAGFPELARNDEGTFESALWKTLQQLHDFDEESQWDPTASSDPDDSSFSFSFAGRAFFVVGMHPGSSRFARRFPVPLLVFNAKAQFDALREDGRFDRMQSKIRDRDARLQGSINPNLAAFGESSEARQYSGREVEPEWRCPFRPRSR